MDFIEELKWRGLFFDMIPGSQKHLNSHKTLGYIGFDPTAPSLGIGNLVQIIILKHFQRAGHQPIALLGGATGMIGDPSGKTEERQLLSEKQLQSNITGFQQQLQKYLDIHSETNPVLMLNNYDWYQNMNMLYFLREIGKHLTVNYMMAKDSVKSRMESGISYTEFTYQLLQAYDFYRLNEDHQCTIQMGGSDQWGNLTSGVELIRRLKGDEAYAVTSPLVTKTDGSKFGKTEKGNIYLNPELTSPYHFYQFWLNVSDADAEKFIKIFTFLTKEEIETLTKQHYEAPHQRTLQQKLAEEVTTFVHSKEEHDKAVKASNILFGRSTTEDLNSLDEATLLSAMDGVPQCKVDRGRLKNGINLIDLLAVETNVLPSKNEAKKMIKGNAISVNKIKRSDIESEISEIDLINNRYILLQKGKKNYYLLSIE
ncbi:MAG: tyrosine--tRNA ligase [Bacteroidetes bacterium SW_10_40_5]|nr:MAG: tyrosine--tRNA ligase [Bacteroidetes bacterium SW_10_40_5]